VTAGGGTVHELSRNLPCRRSPRLRDGVRGAARRPRPLRPRPVLCARGASLLAQRIHRLEPARAACRRGGGARGAAMHGAGSATLLGALSPVGGRARRGDPRPPLRRRGPERCAAPAVGLVAEWGHAARGAARQPAVRGAAHGETRLCPPSAARPPSPLVALCRGRSGAAARRLLRRDRLCAARRRRRPARRAAARLARHGGGAGALAGPGRARPRREAASPQPLPLEAGREAGGGAGHVAAARGRALLRTGRRGRERGGGGLCGARCGQGEQ